MPSPFTSSFASAAAGNASNEGSNGRNTGSGDWSRARANGATQTFRRSSTATNLSHQRDSNPAASNPATTGGSVYIPPHLNSNHQASYARNGASVDTRYSKDQLLDMYRAQAKSTSFYSNVNDLLLDGWTPGVNGASNGGWGKRDDYKDAVGPEICWDRDGGVQPMALQEMTTEEKDAFATSVNSPIKPPTQNANKDATPTNGNPNRRTSISQNITNNSPSIRPGTRRRESGGDLLQSANPLTSPTSSNRFARDESNVSSPPPSLLRRKTDFKDGTTPVADDKEKEFTPSPFGSLKRTTTNPVSAGLNGPTSPWSNAPQSAGFSPMGAFGNFALGGPSAVAEGKKPGFSSTRGESRFKGLMNAGSSEDMGAKVKEKVSTSSLEKLTEAHEQSHPRWTDDRNPQAGGTKRDLYADDDDLGTGSAALGGDDASPPFSQGSRYRKQDRQTSFDEIGFSSLGLTSDMPPFHLQRRDYPHQQTAQQPQAIDQMNEPMSPTNTNPYQSPEGEKAVPENINPDESDYHRSNFGPQYGQGARGFPNQMDVSTGDRSQNSSAGATRGFPSLGSLGNLNTLGNIGGPWSAAPGAIGTPSRAQTGLGPGFGESSLGGLGDLTSPQGGYNGSNFFAGGNSSAIGSTGTFGRGSKLSSLLPTSVREQIQGEAPRQDTGFGNVNDNHATPFGLRDIRGGPDEPFGNMERNRGLQGLTSPFSTHDPGQAPSSQAPITSTPQAQISAAPPNNSYFTRGQEQDANSNQMPATQQRTMVMPDRMRWIYRDPQGNMQGPWSGLEMHDWYKAGFFSPELQVKKLEDTDYEPLAQLIRRIGNSREPFLVPQIGIAHGPPTTLPNSSSVTATAVQATTPSAAQPPFASSFPSFGTTLSAEQQNALERRKQEEQYLMARQKEHLAQQQVMLKQMQQIQGNQLHHHSSAHSLQSQPSYGSITSPMAYQPSTAQGAIQPPASVQGFFDSPSRGAGLLGASIDPMASVREEELPGFMERLNMGRGAQLPYGSEGQGHQQHIAAIMQERARQEREQQQLMQQRGDEASRVSAERLEQYHQLRAQENQQNYQQQRSGEVNVRHQGSDHNLAAQQQLQDSNYQNNAQTSQHDHRQVEPLSLSEQVQKAAATQPQSPWAKVDSGLPQPFPPPQSQSPMPAPTPQRNRQSVADALNAESQSPSNADSVENSSAALAPWAKERDEASKGPSLKEIQAMEAKKAAQQEEIATAARRAVAEQERLNQQNQPTAPAPGLPSSANWASSISPAIPTTGGASPWAKPAAGKPTVATPLAGAKKTLAQIQKEEENKKNRRAAAQAATAASNAANSAPIAGGKRYADLASKPTPVVVQTGTTAWTTVGASGKVKTPTTPAPSLTARTASGGMVQPSAPVSKPKPIANTPAKGPSSQQHANEEFQKWTKNALSKGLNSNISLDEFVTELLFLPAEPDIISDSIYSNSQTLDGRRFAEEFVKRRKMADRGVVPDSNSTSGFSATSNAAENKSSGGWSEVAKKGPVATKEESSAAFKVVGGKKKGGKR